MFYGNNTVKS